MKKFIFPIVFFVSTIPLAGYSQKIALLSHDFKKPIIYTDSVTVEQISSGYFAVGVNDFDTLFACLNYLKNAFKGLSRSKMESWEFRAGNTSLKTTRIPHAYGDTYDVVASSTFNEVKSMFRITTEKNNKRNANHIEDMMSYIEKNKKIFKGAYEIDPKFYEVIVIKE